MEKINSFKIDHTKLLRGIYVSRTDIVGGEVVTTYDIRVCQPYKDTPMDGAAAHTIEHIAATLLRNDEKIGNKVIYFGPMGCLTGFYLILIGAPDINTVWWHMRNIFADISRWGDCIAEPIPGGWQIECGNYKFHSLDGARKIARRFYSDILQHDPSERHTTYPNDVSKVVIICAMECEEKLLKDLRIEGTSEIHLIRSGIGKVNAAVATAQAIDMFEPDVVISFGYAGGLGDGMKGKMVFADKVFYHDVWHGEGNELGQVQGSPMYFYCANENKYITKAFTGLLAKPLVYGTIATGDYFVESTAMVNKIANIYPGTIAVDMESAAIAQVCEKVGTPFMAYRLVSDIVGAQDQVDQYERTIKGE